MDLKQTLKSIKLHQEQISIVLGIIILIIAGIYVVRYINNLNDQNIKQAPETQNQNTRITHTVIKGETLWSIAKKYYQKGSDWKKIANANNIANPAKLEVGTNLSIPDTVAPSPKAQITETAASTDSSIKTENYTVVKGDNLWKIAVRAYGDGYKWNEIAHANNLKNPNLIHSGNVFLIPR